MNDAKERLSKVLEENGLTEMAQLARNGYYSDFDSPLAFPIMQLVKDLNAVNKSELAIRAMKGEFDGY